MKETFSSNPQYLAMIGYIFMYTLMMTAILLLSVVRFAQTTKELGKRSKK